MKAEMGMSDEDIIAEAAYLFEKPGLMFLQRRYGIGYARASRILTAIKKQRSKDEGGD